MQLINLKYNHIILAILLFLIIDAGIMAQPALPARTLSVEATQSLNFGTFCLSSSSAPGGTVTVGWDGSRSYTGDIILLSGFPGHAPAIFEVNLCQGRNIIITYSATTVLTGNNGGSLTLNIGPTEKGGSGSSFPVNYNCQFITPLRVGGTLDVGPNMSNPGGVYTGSFSITFNQQ